MFELSDDPKNPIFLKSINIKPKTKKFEIAKTFHPGETENGST